jgi:transcriptional regulator GlxA family with amidase domain
VSATSRAFHSRLLSDDVQRRLAYYPRALDAAHYVRSNLSGSVRLEDVAERAGMTACAFSRYFAEKTGITFSTLLKVLRIERALDDLESHDAAIAHVAERTGYQSNCTFSRAFKDVMGKTPSEYRRCFLFARTT